MRLETALPEVVLLEPKIIEDARGWFYESYRCDEFSDVGIPVSFVQENQSRSVKDTLRGLHLQVSHPQAKLCRVICGEVFDVAVDVRRGSPTFGQWVGAVISADNRRQFFVPIGFAHGFVVLSDFAEFLYKCSDYYDRVSEVGIAWNDPAVAIRWPISSPLLSPKDALAPMLHDIPPDRLPIYLE